MRVLALDVGERRIGVAISDPSGTIARPLQTLARGSREEDFAAIAALVAEHGVGLVVVGRPLSLNGTEGPQARRVARYAEALTATLPVPVTAWDERFTTVTAEEILRQTRRKKRRARDKGEVDAVAAAVILQSYLDSQNGGFQDGNG
ncbi:MAG TPA: Holliday junction resolvase RuvX [Thermoflexia bacterium]|nr:MAG: Holliday junction resolvase RuvX [Chloroflexota bacterium]HEY67809.1 Holliday junction resolvase RuvX [Thermoflexia bacterium]